MQEGGEKVGYFSPTFSALCSISGSGYITSVSSTLRRDTTEVSPSVRWSLYSLFPRIHHCVSVPIWVQATTATQGLKKDSGIESKIEKMSSLTWLSFCKLGRHHCCFIRAVFILSLLWPEWPSMSSSSPPDPRRDPHSVQVWKAGPRHSVNLRCLFRQGGGSTMRYSRSGGW